MASHLRLPACSRPLAGSAAFARVVQTTAGIEQSSRKVSGAGGAHQPLLAVRRTLPPPPALAYTSSHSLRT